MAGYRHKRKRINVTFEGDHEYAGFEAVLRGKSLGEYLNLMGIGEVDMSGIADQLKEMGRALISWNLLDEDTGEPIPPTQEAVYEQDQDLMLALATAWADGLAGVSAPLESGSTDGQPSLEASLPMEPLSLSQAS
ncbi:hypothetical protein [Streptomyces niveus]|uniref:hypothetical protein n=1 Tax=Streptomyces niveus TaxID=193462 RepID=UPI00084C2AA6|nr:hypothetical protein [Streptomyces niveus]